MLEKEIEKRLVTRVRLMNGWALKLVCPGMDGIPDRLILLPGKKVGFVELKAGGKKMRPLQVKRKKQLEALGFSVYCLDDPKRIGEILDEIQSS